MAQALINLIENAIKYTPSGRVEIDFQHETPEIVNITVRDTGIGIPENNLKHIFQKFYRVDNSDTREINGTGLGLYLTKQIVKTLNGRVWAESELGKGSVFYISLNSLSDKKAKTLQDLAVIKPENTTLTTEAPSLETFSQPVTNQTTLEPIQTNSQPASQVVEQPTVSEERVLSAETAERLKALGYNTDSYEIK